MENMKKWYCCEKCQKVDYYYVHDDGTTSFNRGELLAHNEFLTTGFDSKEEAEKWLKTHPSA